MKFYFIINFILLLILLGIILGQMSMMNVSMLKLGLMDMEALLYFDWMSLFFMLTVLMISKNILMYIEEYMELDKSKYYFYSLIILFILSMLLMLISPNSVSIMLGWDGLGLISYCLVIYFKNESSYSSGMITVMTNRLGDVGIILSMVFFSMFYSWNMIFYMEGGLMMNILMLLMLMGMLTKSAQLPFSAWLPAAMAAPTPVSSLVHSSTLVTAGVYLGLRMYKFFSGGMYSEVLMMISILTMSLAGMSASIESDMKKVVALSTLSQLGVMMMSVSLGFYKIALFHLIVHAFFKATLFMCMGVLIHSENNNQDMRKFFGVGKKYQNIKMIILICSMSMCGFPFLSGFYSKDMLLEACYSLNNSYIIMFLMWLGTMLTTVYSMKLLISLNKMEEMGKLLISLNKMEEMEKSILNLVLNVIWLGSILQWLLPLSNMMIYLSYTEKMINLLLISGGVLLSISFKMGNKFFGSFIYLFIISYNFSFKFVNNILMHDQSWMEVMSGNLKILNKNFTTMFKLNMMMMIFLMMMIMTMI